jgi:hypothetical protein
MKDKKIQLAEHLLLARKDLRGEHLRIAGARVANRSEHPHLAEADRARLIKEVIAFLGACNSSCALNPGSAGTSSGAIYR